MSRLTQPGQLCGTRSGKPQWWQRSVRSPLGMAGQVLQSGRPLYQPQLAQYSFGASLRRFRKARVCSPRASRSRKDSDTFGASSCTVARRQTAVLPLPRHGMQQHRVQSALGPKGVAVCLGLLLFDAEHQCCGGAAAVLS